MGWCVPSWMFEWHSCETWVNVGQNNILTWFWSDQIVLYKWWWIVCLNNGKQTNTSFRGKLITVCTPWVINQATLHESLALKVTPNKTRHACQWQHIPACKLIWLNLHLSEKALCNQQNTEKPEGRPTFDPRSRLLQSPPPFFHAGLARRKILLGPSPWFNQEAQAIFSSTGSNRIIDELTALSCRKDLPHNNAPFSATPAIPRSHHGLGSHIKHHPPRVPRETAASVYRHVWIWSSLNHILHHHHHLSSHPFIQPRRAARAARSEGGDQRLPLARQLHLLQLGHHQWQQLHLVVDI